MRIPASTETMLAKILSPVADVVREIAQALGDSVKASERVPEQTEEQTEAQPDEPLVAGASRGNRMSRGRLAHPMPRIPRYADPEPGAGSDASGSARPPQPAEHEESASSPRA